MKRKDLLLADFVMTMIVIGGLSLALILFEVYQPEHPITIKAIVEWFTK